MAFDKELAGDLTRFRQVLNETENCVLTREIRQHPGPAVVPLLRLDLVSNASIFVACCLELRGIECYCSADDITSLQVAGRSGKA